MTDFTPRPTVYKGIRMRSRLEAGFAKWLDEVRFQWEYEPKAFAGSHGQYLPDFVLHDVPCSWRETPADIYVEVKPAPWFEQMDETAEPLLKRMTAIWESEPEAEALLACNLAAGQRKLYLLEREASPAFTDPYPWPCAVELVYYPKLTPGFASRIEHMPWTGRWWER